MTGRGPELLAFARLFARGHIADRNLCAVVSMHGQVDDKGRRDVLASEVLGDV